VGTPGGGSPQAKAQRAAKAKSRRLARACARGRNSRLGKNRFVTGECVFVIHAQNQAASSENRFVGSNGASGSDIGQYYDSETGFFYNMNRYFDPATGRYTSVDPLGLLAGVNPYIYVLNNPLSYIDPFGLDPWTLITSPFRRDGGIPEQDLIGLENDFSAIEGAATTAAAVGPYALTVAGSAVGEAGGMVCRAATPKNTRSLFTALRMFERLYGGPEIETELSEMSQEMAEQRLLPGGKLNPTPPPPPSPPNIGGP
jgi:RHS repeat-associated protein